MSLEQNTTFPTSDIVPEEISLSKRLSYTFPSVFHRSSSVLHLVLISLVVSGPSLVLHSFPLYSCIVRNTFPRLRRPPEHSGALLVAVLTLSDL
jgi:hypothetical protein